LRSPGDERSAPGTHRAPFRGAGGSRVGDSRRGGDMATMSSAVARAFPLRPAGERTIELRALDDSTVVASFLAGEARAFDELMRRYQDRLTNFVFRMIGDRGRSEDLVQE